MSAIVSISTQLQREHRQSFRTLAELALLVNLVNPGQLLHTTSTRSEGLHARDTKAWCRFIDAFASLADFLKGGASVAAISGVEISDQPTLLIASNNGVHTRILGHLRYVLESLHSFRNGNAKDQAEIRQKLLKSSVNIGRDKIRNYRKRMVKWLNRVENDPEVSRLKEKVEHLHDTAEQHYELCQWAYEFSKSQELQYLNEQCSHNPRSDVYYQIRHYIGRLGSWHRAVSTLVSTAIQYPHFLQGLSLDAVPQQVTAWRASEKATELCQLLELLDLGFSTDHVMSRLDKLHRTVRRNNQNTCEDVQAAFLQRVTDEKFRPRVHAEVLLADYIHATKLRFINDLRYIGCSKPSCVLCHMYLEAHPTGIMPLPCHGNLWPNWSPPLLTSTGIHQHTVEFTQKMILNLQGFIMQWLMNGQVSRRRLPESTTGFTLASHE